MSRKTKTFLIDLLYDFAGALLAGIGIYTFAINAKFAPVGVSGLSLILNYMTGLPVGMLSLILNIPIVLVCFRLLGPKFLLKSLKTMLIFAFVQDYVVPLIPMYNGNQLLAALCTGAFAGAGFAIVYTRNTSSGGTDFLVMALRKLFPHMSIGTLGLFVDGVVILLGGFVFKNIDAIIYGMIATIVTTVAIDKVMYGIGAGKLALIVTENGRDVGDAIADVTQRGVTFLKGEGQYSKNEKQVVMCACSKNQVIFVQRTAYEIDPKCFIMITELNSIFGEGFEDMSNKDRL